MLFQIIVNIMINKLFKPTKFKLILFVVIFVILYIILFTLPFTIPAKVQCFVAPCPQAITTTFIYILFPSLIAGGSFLPIVILLVLSYIIASLITYKRERKNRRGIATEYLIWLSIALAVLVILMISIFILKGEGVLLIEKIKDLFR